MTAYYNEIDPYASQWLRNLIAAGHIAPGEVDERSIVDVRPDDVRGFTQCHFFAGVGVWSYAARLAGWPDDRPLWTGSCPCQPFSVAGKRGGAGDERHLWPVFYDLIRECRPPVVIGEQVASSDVTGRLSKNPDYVRGLRDREIFRELSRARLSPEISGHLQRLSERTGAQAQAQQSDENGCAEGSVEGREQGVSFGLFSQSASARQESRIRPGGGGDPETHRHGPMRNDGNPLRSGWGLERAFSGSDRPGGRLHDGERASGPDCTEHHDEPLGCGESDEYFAGYEGQDGSARDEQLLFSLFSGEDESQDRPAWFDAVSDDLERAHYSVGACIAPACGFGAPHIRQRLYWAGTRLALPEHGGREAGQPERIRSGATLPSGIAGGMGDARSQSGERHSGTVSGPEASGGGSGRADGNDSNRYSDAGVSSRLADDLLQQRPNGEPGKRAGDDANGRVEGPAAATGFCRDLRPVPTNGFWGDPDWLFCRDERWRPVESGTFPLAHGAPARVGRLRAYGNAIVAEQARGFIEAVMEAA